MPQLRLPADDRRELITDVAFGLVAERGFEGFRTRDVADLAGINPATLHHYFSTKEHLIDAIGQRLADRLSREHAPRRPNDHPLAELRRHFADARFYLERHPELIAVYRELALRAIRDAHARTVVAGLDRAWIESIAASVKTAQADNVIRPDVDPPAVATMIVAAIWGAIVLLRIGPTGLDRIRIEVERSLIAPGGAR